MLLTKCLNRLQPPIRVDNCDSWRTPSSAVNRFPTKTPTAPCLVVAFAFVWWGCLRCFLATCSQCCGSREMQEYFLHTHGKCGIINKWKRRHSNMNKLVFPRWEAFLISTEVYGTFDTLILNSHHHSTVVLKIALGQNVVSVAVCWLIKGLLTVSALPEIAESSQKSLYLLEADSQ